MQECDPPICRPWINSEPSGINALLQGAPPLWASPHIGPSPLTEQRMGQPLKNHVGQAEEAAGKAPVNPHVGGEMHEYGPTVRRDAKRACTKASIGGES